MKNMPSIEFVYFDLGNVLVSFDNGKALSQLAQATQASVAEVAPFFGDSELQLQMERGQIDFDEAYEALCESLGKRPPKSGVREAISAIFELRMEMVPLVAALSAANIRVGILSNTCEPHWSYVSDGRYGILPDYFEICTLSYEVGAMKPDAKIYAAAADSAGVEPSQIFFTDDLHENVEAARAFGFIAEPFLSASRLAQSLQSQGLRFNY